jgi:hypothetical protein
MSSRLQTANDLHLLSSPSMWLCAVAAAFTMATTVHAANTADDVQPPANAESMTPKQAYDHDKAYCNSQQATEQRSLCLKEASRAYQEARAGKLEPTTTASSDDTSTSTSGTSSKHRAHRMHHSSKNSQDNSNNSSTNNSTTSNSGTSQ